jgi:hypothetical protein
LYYADSFLNNMKLTSPDGAGVVPEGGSLASMGRPSGTFSLYDTETQTYMEV